MSDEPLFELVGTRMMPILAGLGRQPDNVRFFTLDQAAAKSGRPASLLQSDWLTYFNADVADPEDRTEAATATVLNAPPARVDAVSRTINATRLRLLRQVRFPYLNDEQWQHVVSECDDRRIDPMLIWAKLERNFETDRDEVVMITTIAAIRIIAHRTGERAGESAPEWSGPDGKWLKVWPDETPPHAARVFVRRRGHEEPYEGVAYFRFHAQTTLGANRMPVLTPMWEKGSPHMLGKCASALAHRLAWPEVFGGLYTNDEIPPVKPGEKGEDTAAGSPTSRQETPMLTVADDPRFAWSLVDEATPSTMRSLLLSLMDVGECSSSQAQAIIDQFKVKLPRLSRGEVQPFSAVVLRCVKESPAAYGLVAA